LKKAQPTVLVVEDEWLVLADLAAELTQAGWNVIEARTGEGAVEELRNGHRINLLVTDIQLAGHVSGWEVAEIARTIEPDLPVIYASGNPANEARKVAGSVFLSKPCQGSKIAKLGRELVGTRDRDPNGD
jgi:CheY-like chemotaxis protein